MRLERQMARLSQGGGRGAWQWEACPGRGVSGQRVEILYSGGSCSRSSAWPQPSWHFCERLLWAATFGSRGQLRNQSSGPQPPQPCGIWGSASSVVRPEGFPGCKQCWVRQGPSLLGTRASRLPLLPPHCDPQIPSCAPPFLSHDAQGGAVVMVMGGWRGKLQGGEGAHAQGGQAACSYCEATTGLGVLPWGPQTRGHSRSVKEPDRTQASSSGSVGLPTEHRSGASVAVA